MTGESDTIRWSHKSFEELQTFWNTQIEPALQRAGHDLDERPTYQDLLDTGYGGIQYTLREHHEMTLGAFLETVGYADGPSADGGYPWMIDDETTIDELELYLESLERRRNLAESTIKSKQARLATYARVYRDLHGQATLVTRVAAPDDEADEIQRVLAVFDELNQELGSDESKLRYLSDIQQFYEHLQRRAKASFNPTASIAAEYGWTRTKKDNQPLSSQQVRRLYGAAETASEQLLVLALCAWGLRRSEVAALHVSQLVLEGEQPHIAFDDDRKNGPGTVALIYGVPELSDRIDALSSGTQEWNGYLFPSKASSSGHITGETVQARFKRLADRAAVRVRGEQPTSKMGRRFWYTTYNQAMNALLENLDVIATEQGSADSSVVLKSYLSEAERREYRREFMRERLADAFEQRPQPS